MSDLKISAHPFVFEARFERTGAPLTCAWFESQLPFRTKVIHARWSGEAVWMPLGALVSDLQPENHTVYPSRGDILFYPGGISETEILFTYGNAAFASTAGPLAGNHFLTITKGREQLQEFGRHILWNGALDIEFES